MYVSYGLDTILFSLWCVQWMEWDGMDEEVVLWFEIVNIRGNTLHLDQRPPAIRSIYVYKQDVKVRTTCEKINNNIYDWRANR